MPYKRGNVYYTKRRFTNIGLVRRSLETESKARADQMEHALIELHKQGRYAPVRAFASGDLSADDLYEAFASGKVGELEERLRNGPSPALGKAIDETLEIEAADMAASTLGRYRASFAHVLKFHGKDLPVSDALTNDAVKRFKSARRKAGAAEQTVNNDLQAVSLLASRAVAQGWVNERPTIKRFPYRERIRYLEPDEQEAYLTKLAPEHRPQMRCQLGSALRLGEAERLRASDVQGNTIRVRTGKSAKASRVVHIPDWLAAELAERKPGEGGRLFADHARRSVQTAHNEACAAAKIEDYTIHDHRHTYAVARARAGMPLGVLQRQMGHKSIQTTMKYAAFHPDYSDVAEYEDKVAERFGLNGDAEGGDSNGDGEDGDE